MMSGSLWKRVFPGTAQKLDTGGTAAREHAERELARVRSETPYYVGLGRDLRALRERNHIADRIRTTIREA
jgi:hypothetical protein